MKKKLLIINLSDHKKIISSGVLISKICTDEKYDTVSLLIFEEFRSSALVLSNVDEIITIDREMIQSVFNNRIYPKHFALNLFIKKIDYIRNGGFDLIVNYSGDKAASYISGYLFQNIAVCGPYYSFKNHLCHTNEWGIVNEMTEEMTCLPFDRNDVYAKMMGLNVVKPGIGYVVREKHEKTVEHSLNKLRSLNQHKGKKPKVVGICVGSEKKSQSIPIKIIMDTLREMRNQKNFLPLVITGINDEDESVAKMINERFGHSLTLVKMDIVAAPSLLKGLDALVCPDTYFKHLTSLTRTPLVELSFGNTSIQGGINGSIVAAVLNEKSFYGENVDMEPIMERNFLKPSDIVKILSYVLQDGNPEKLHVDSNAAVYMCKRKGEDVFYEKIDEGKEGSVSIHRVMTRNMIMLRFYQLSDFNEKFDYLLLHNSRESLKRWISSERKMVATLMRDILSVVRLVLQSQKDKGKARELAYKFDNLFSYEKTNSPVRIPVFFLRGLIFSMDKVDLILEEIYKTKNHLQKYSLLVEELDNYQRKRGVVSGIERYSGVANV